MRYELIVERKINYADSSPELIYLDTFDSESISLNYNIADVNDLSNKNSSYSKTIKLPNTGRNRAALNNIFNLESSLDYFPQGQFYNPNEKIKAYVLQDGLNIFEGNLQLTNINYDYNNNIHSYDVIIYSENDGLFKRIGEGYLSDLDLSRYNHQYNYSSIVGSWTASYQSGYYYPMIDWGIPLSMDRTFNITDFKVGIYARIIFDQIFAEAGYSYQSDFINSDFFSKLLVIPSVSNSPGFTNLITTTNKEGLIVGQNGSENYRWNRTNPGLNVGNFWDPALALYFWDTIEVDTIIFDPNNLYATGSQIYTAPQGQRLAQRIKIDFGLIETGVFYDTWSGLPNFPSGTTPKWTYPNAQGPNPDPDTADFHLRDISDDIRIYVKREYINNGGGATSSNFTTPNPTYTQVLGNNGYFSQGSQNVWSNLKFNGQEWYSIRYDKNFNVGYNTTTNLWQYSGSITTDLIVDPLTIREGEKIRIFVVRPLILKTGSNIPSYYGTATGTLADFKLNVSNVKISVIFDDTRQVANGLVNIPKQLSNIKQKDFLISIIRMFNLYLEPSKSILNTFLIEPRDEYYQKYGTLKDWSKKIDLNKSIQNEIASNKQSRTQYFSHKADKDFYNNLYTQTTNTIFGEYKYEFDNEFTSGENKIETIFSPTPNNLLAKSRAMVIPSILSQNNGNYSNYSGGNPRILYVNTLGLTGGDNYKMWPNGVGVGTAITQSLFPYAGFSDDPFNPTKSLNFGDVKSFVTGYNETQNNLYYTYWSNAILDLNSKDSRFLTANFYLNANDINQFTFADLIYISVDNMAGYYRVNKILDYDPNSYESVKVELVKALTYVTDLPIGNGNCPVLLKYCLCGDNLQSYLDAISSYIDPFGLEPFLVWKSSNDDNYYPFSLPEFGPIDVDTIVDWFNTIPGALASYTPGDSSCILNFEIEMGEEAANTFIGSINEYYDNNPGAAYLAIYLDYPCGATFGTWVEDDNVYFLTVEEGFTQYTFLDWWLNNIDGAYGTASGEPLAEGAYLKLGWNWETSCLTASNATQSFSISITLDESQTESFIEQVNNAYISGDYTYVFFSFNYPDTPVPYNPFYTIPNATQSITDITTWFNSNLPGGSASTIDGITTFEINWEYLCDICYKEYTFYINLANDLILETLFFNTTTAPCISDCEGTGLNLKVCFSNVDYLPGGWTPELFCDGPLLEDGSGPVFEAGGLTYGESQDICICVGDTLCFEYNTSLGCPGGLVTLENYIGSNTSYEENIETMWIISDGCVCEDNPNQITLPQYQDQSQGFRNFPIQDQIYSGVINTSNENIIKATNNIVSGNNNFVYDSSNIVSGNNNGAILGRGNLIMGDDNYNIFGSRNFLLGASISTLDGTSNPSVLVGNNIVNEYEGSFVFGNNITLTLPVSPTGSTADSPSIQDIFIVGNNITLTGSVPNNTTFLGTENIILSQDGGFNTPFIISEAVSTPEIPTGQTIIKTYTGRTITVQAGFTPPNIYYVLPWTNGMSIFDNGSNKATYDDIKDFSIVQIEVSVRCQLDGIAAAGDDMYAFFNRGIFIKNPYLSGLPDFTQIAIDTGFSGNIGTDVSASLTSITYDVISGANQPVLEIVNNSATLDYIAYYDITLKYQYQ